MIEAFPLYWPDNWQRTAPSQRKRNDSWKYGFGRYLQDLLHELKLLGAKNVIVSSNLRLRRDGLPAADQREPEDAGVAVYFDYGKRKMSFACDRWTQTRLNVHAIGLTIAAIRTIERNGASDMMERAFRGFTALPERAMSSWREVLGFRADEPADAAKVEDRFRDLAHVHHPDKGGDPERFRQIVEARDAARQAVGI